MRASKPLQIWRQKNVLLVQIDLLKTSRPGNITQVSASRNACSHGGGGRGVWSLRRRRAESPAQADNTASQDRRCVRWYQTDRRPLGTLEMDKSTDRNNIWLVWIFLFTSGREASPCCGQKEHLGPPAGAVRILLLLSSADSCECVETPLRPRWDPAETWDITTPRQQRQVKTNGFSFHKCETFSLILVAACSVWSNGGSEARPQHQQVFEDFQIYFSSSSV